MNKTKVKVKISIEPFDEEGSIFNPITLEIEVIADDEAMGLLNWKVICAGLVERTWATFWDQMRSLERGGR